ncbi:MAG: glycosyltransferase family 25 protein [Chlamydiia bacterium]
MTLLFFSSTPLFSSTYYENSPLFKLAKKIDSFESPTHLKFVDCVYVVNLESRPEKWDRTNKFLLDQGVKATRFIGVDGFDLSSEEQLLITNGNPFNFSPGQIGCYLSHISIYQHAFENNFDYIWICEDDIQPVADIHQISSLIQELNKFDRHWDVLYTDIDYAGWDGTFITEQTIHLPPQRAAERAYFTKKFHRKNISPTLQKLGLRFGTYSYLVSRRGVQKYIQHFAKKVMECPIDADMHYIRGLREYCTRHNIVIQLPGNTESDVNRKEKGEFRNKILKF